jgi:hypothetical protein
MKPMVPKALTKEEVYAIMRAGVGDTVTTVACGVVTKVAIVGHDFQRQWWERMTHVFQDSAGNHWGFEHDIFRSDFQKESFYYVTGGCGSGGGGGVSGEGRGGGGASDAQHVLAFGMSKVETTTYSYSYNPDKGGIDYGSKP